MQIDERQDLLSADLYCHGIKVTMQNEKGLGKETHF